MKKAVLIPGLLAAMVFAVISMPPVSALEDRVCVLYFTYVGCPNCATTDPIVLSEWTGKYDNLVVIEHMWYGHDYQDPDSQFFGTYAMEYGTQAAVPYLSIDEDNIRMGRADVPAGEADISSMGSNPCPLAGGSVPFGELDLNELEGEPKIWANGRILLSLGEDRWLFQWDGDGISGDIAGSEGMSNEMVKELLFTEDISGALEGKRFETSEPLKAEFSGAAFPEYDFVPHEDFENAVEIGIGIPGCPDCPDPGEWSGCIEGERTRTNYRCSEETGFECVPYEQTGQCSGDGNSGNGDDLTSLAGFAAVPVIILIIIIVIVFVFKRPGG